MKPFVEVLGRPSGSKIPELRFSDSKCSIPLCVLGALGGSNKCKFDRILNFAATKCPSFCRESRRGLLVATLARFRLPCPQRAPNAGEELGARGCTRRRFLETTQEAHPMGDGVDLSLTAIPLTPDPPLPVGARGAENRIGAQLHTRAAFQLSRQKLTKASSAVLGAALLELRPGA